MLEIEYNFFKTNLAEFLKKHPGEYVVIKGEEVLGSYSSLKEALQAMAGKHEPGTFLIQHCVPLEDSIHRFHSRVAFK